MRELRKWISTSGKEWLELQKAVASNQEQMASAAENIAKAAANTSPLPPPPVAPAEDSAAGLKNLLGISRPAPTPAPETGYMSAAEQEEASRRLKEILGGKPQTPTHAVNGPSTYGPPPAVSENPNAQVLLSILQGGPAPPPTVPTPQASTPHSPPTHSSARPGFMSFPMPGNQNQPPNMSGPPPHHAPPPPVQTRQPLGPMYHNSPVSMPSPGVWQQRTNNYHLPSPPPTSRYGPPPPMMQQYQQNQQRGSMNQFYPNQPPMQPGNVAHHPFGPQLHHAPPTPVDSFHPPPQQPMLPAKPQDPGQAGALLSILKGTNVPAAMPPTQTQQPEAQAVQPHPAPQQPPQQQRPVQPVQPQLPQQPQQPLQKPTTPPAPTHAPSVPLRSPPRGPRSQTPQRNSPHVHPSQRHRMATSGRTSAPPTRPGTAGPRHVSPPPLRRGTPVVLDHYGAQKPATVPTTNFDRRESVSGTRAQTLLAMFKAPAPPVEESAVMSSPETEKVVPAAVRTPRRLATPVGMERSASKAKTPVGQAKAGLLAYLEGVASENGDGGVSLT
jgi:mRNA-decapping enzyme subunit 2